MSFRSILLVFFIFCIIFPLNGSMIEFQYGFLLKKSYKDNKIEALSDSSKVTTGDWLKINLGYKRDTQFYILYQDADGQYMPIYNSNDVSINSQDDVFVSAMLWTEMQDPTGIEKFYFINYKESFLSDLISLVGRYESAPSRGKQKLSMKIKQKLESINPDIDNGIAVVDSRLSKPILGGVAFRGDDDGNVIKDLHVTHNCIGSNILAFKKITLVHY